MTPFKSVFTFLTNSYAKAKHVFDSSVEKIMEPEEGIITNMHL